MTRVSREIGLDVVYDGLCRFCKRSLAAVQRIGRRPLLRLHDANDHEQIWAAVAFMMHPRRVSRLIPLYPGTP
jgi:predicted DCC family thiol-disulfide oxidoreductase YuxK